MLKKLVMISVAVIAAFCSFAATETVNGITWTYTVSNGKASVGGGSSSSPAVPKSTSGAITIPSILGGYPVTSIGYSAFSDCRSLTSVTIPDSVTSIGVYAFSDCRSLTSVTIPESVTNIGNSAFDSCSSLTSVTIPDSVTSIGVGAFEGCSGLADSNWFVIVKGVLYDYFGEGGDVVIPNSVTSIGGYAFENCSSLTSVTIGKSVTSIGYRAFNNCYSLTSITIPDSVTSIGDCAFDSCSSLTSVTIPDSVTSIGVYAFYYCSSLVSVTIPDSVTSIGEHAFSSCSSLKEVHISDLAKWCNIGFSSYDANPLYYAHNLYLNGNKVTQLVIPDSVTSIGDCAFSGCSSLTSVTIPESVTGIGGSTFSGCSSLTSVTIPESVTNIGRGAFYYCSSLTSVTIPDSVTSIGGQAFSGCRPTSVTVPGGKCGIDFSAVTNLVISEGTESIGDWAFYGCSSLTSVTIPNSVTSIGDRAFYGCSSLTSVTIPNSVTSIGDRVFYGCSSLTSVTIPNSVTSIEYGAFSDCSSLTSVTIPDSVTSIGDQAFSGCEGLVDEHGFVIIKNTLYDYYGEGGAVTIPESVTNIGKNAFYDCSSLVSVTIPDSVTNIGEYAFRGCAKLQMIEFEGDAPSCSSWVIPTSARIQIQYGSRGFDVYPWTQYDYTLIYPLERDVVNGEIVIGNGKRNAFTNGFSGATLDIPSSIGDVPVTSIADYAFYGMSNLVTLTVPSSITNIGKYAFGNCKMLRTVRFLGDAPVANEIYSDEEGNYGNITSVVLEGSRGWKDVDSEELPEKWQNRPIVFEPIKTSGTISSSTIWRGGKIYNVTGNLTLKSGVTLTIEPGAIIKFNSGVSLTVNSGATLNAIGTRAQPIVFTSIKDDEYGGDTNGDGDKTYPYAGDWHQITGSGTVSLNYCQVLWCSQQNNQGGLYPQGGNWTFDNSIIAHCEYDCMRSYGGTFTARNSIFTDSSMGVAPSSGICKFINCIFYDLTTAVRWGSGSYYNCIFAKIYQDIIDTKFYSSTVSSPFANCCFYNPEGTGDHADAKVGTNGNFWGDPKFVDAENGDFRISADSPCIDVGDGSVAPETDYYGQPRYGAPEIGVYEVIGANSTGYDLAASSVSSTGVSPVQGDGNAQAARSTIGDVLDISYVVTNVGRKAVSDPWHDALYLVSSSSGKQYALGELLNNGTLGVNESRTSTVKFTVPVLPIGKYSIRLVVNSRRMDVPEGSATENNTVISESEIEIVADSVDVSEGASGSVSAGSSAVCAFTVPSGTGDKLMRVTSVSGGESLFARCGLGFLPVDAASGTGLSFIGGAAYILVPAGIENVWLVLDNDGSSAASYEVEFLDGSLALTGVSPSNIPSSGNITVEIAGTGFTDDCEVSFAGAGTVAPISVKRVSQGLLAVTVDAAKFGAGNKYSVVVKKGVETKTFENALTVAAAPGEPKFWAKLDVPSSMRQGRLVETCFIEYGNSGTADMISPVLQVSMTGDGTLGYMGGQSGLKTLQFIAAGDKGSAGVLRPGSSHRIRFAIRAGASNKISLHTSEDSDYAPAPWTNAADYLADLSAAATRIGLAEQDATDYPKCMELAKSSSGLSCVSGRLLDRTYGILPGVKVTLAGESNALDVYTDDKGRFFFDLVPRGTYDLIFDGRITCKKDVSVSDRDLHFGDLEINANVDYVAYVDGVSSIEAGTMKLYGDDIMIAPIIIGDTALFYNVSNGVYTIEYSDGKNIAMQTVVINDESLASCYLVPEKIILEKIQFPEDFDMGKDTYYYLIGNNGLYYEGVQSAGSRIIEKTFSSGKYWIMIYDEEQFLSSYIIDISDKSVDFTAVDAKKELQAAKFMTQPSKKLLNAKRSSENESINVRVENLCKEARALVQGLSIEEPLGDVFCTHSFAKMREDKLLLSDFKVRTEWLEYRLGITRGLYMKKHAKAIKAVFLGAADLVAAVFGLPVTSLNDLLAEMFGDREISGTTALFTVLDITLDNPQETLDIVRYAGVPVSKEMSQMWLKMAPKLSRGLTMYGIFDRFSEIGDVSDEIDNAFAILATHADVFEQELNEFKVAKKSFNQYFSCCNQIYPKEPYEFCINTTTPSVPKSCDPNEMVGEDGVGDARYIKPGQELTYTIYFENKQGFDIADAQEVRVTNPLSKWLDWSTFEMREVAFNNQNDVALDGLANGASEVRMNGTNKYVRTTVECDTKTGVVTWYMRVYDPNGDSEGYPTDGSGFLPSNDETHRGEGHLTYRIKLRNDAPSNVVITNSATIVFDYNDPIETDPAWWNTVAATVDVNCDGGLTLDDLVVGLPFGELSNPEPREGYIFEGWYTGKNGTGIRVTADTIVTADMTSLYAHWTKSTPEPAPEPEPEPTPTPEPDSRIKWTIENGVLVEVELNGATVAVIPDEVTVIGPFAFSFCSTLKEVVIPNTVTEIGYCAFHSCSFTSVIIPESVTVINDSAFRDCRLLTSLIVPNNIIRIGDYAFEYCDSLRTVYIPKRLKGELSLFKIFALCPSDIKIIYYEGNSPEDDTNPEVIEGLTSSLGGVKLYGTVDGLPSAKSASVYDGYLYLDNVVMGSIQAKLSKPKVNKKSGVTTAKTSVTIQINGEKKVSLKGELDFNIGEFTATDKKSDRTLILKFGLDGITGTFGNYDIDGARNLFDSKDKSEKSTAEEILKPYLGAYSMILDGGILSVSIAKKGKVTIKGAIDGNKVSAKAQALIGEDMICIPVIYSKKSVNLAFTIWLPINGGDAVIIGLDDAIIGKAGTLKNGAKFIIDGDIGASIETEDPRTLELLPDNETITVSKSKWLVADGIKPAKVAYKKGEFTITEGKKGAGIVNPSGLKLSYKSKDGSFKGSFTAYAIVKGKLKKHKATVEGILIGDVGYGTITIKKIGTWGVTIE